MTVLVTGGAGYIGSHMVLALKDAGRSVVVLDDLSCGFSWLVPEDVAFCAGDVGDQPLVRALIRKHNVTAILHFAGSIVVPDSVRDPLFYYRNNTVQSRALIEAAIAEGVGHFIFSSTAAVYGEPEKTPISEEMPHQPISPYGTSKLMTEWMLRDAAVAHPDFNYVALRYFNVAGADPLLRSGQSFPRATHLIKIASQAATGERSHIEVYGKDYATTDGTCVRDYIHVSDLAQAHLCALNYLEAGGKSTAANCGYGYGYSVLEIIDAVKRVSGIDFPVHMAPRRAGDPAILVAGNDRIRNEFGFVAGRADLELIVGDALAWERKLQSMKTDEPEERAAG
ncbi:UDP-glucose 4-epimerase GalE [Phyllobacterium endophyticum]|uniref:UDP-glucose 4-epimerase n=1 Tax=Phyllobacterium endophyticum TaxID=1149773 RepID=A0A2P7AMQ1_9HYPH|nr:UDP-glucose 4-epimerase GalE [Phyllobacterium endophyticum]MBB3238278.1 UDP-glucose 4-epimerase [Phyllobacterium endophyticum]PSH55483.1 UDP-glucose 4-epimerase GalE [Phyllobacterium endophyticum]TYR40218.1 UDP-glucose 4-epimerase GalE [Phyllobacterium endophyticum]